MAEFKIKKSTHLVDSDLKPFLDRMPELHLTVESLPKIREELAAQLGSMENGVLENLPVEISERFIPGPPGAPKVRVIVITPINTPIPRPAYLHIHGGGMVLGTAEEAKPNYIQLSIDLKCSVVSVDYRLAPETPHPGPVEDCYAALKWMHDCAEELGIDRAKIAIGGGSAGGGIAAALAVMARDRNEVNVLFQLLQVPMLDDRTCIAEPNPYAGEYAWTLENNRFGWRSLLGCEPGMQGISPYASAPRADDLAGLPAAFISVGAIELFVDECIDYSKRLIRAGVPTELHVYPGVHHAAPLVAEARVTKAMARDSHEALRRAFYG